MKVFEINVENPSFRFPTGSDAAFSFLFLECLSLLSLSPPRIHPPPPQTHICPLPVVSDIPEGQVLEAFPVNPFLGGALLVNPLAVICNDFVYFFPPIKGKLLSTSCALFVHISPVPRTISPCLK